MEASKRELVRQRAGNRCEYCLLPEEADEWPFHLEHVIAKQHGGGDDVENLSWAGSRCNLCKGTNLVSVDQETGAMAALYHPRHQQWPEHFAVRNAIILGRTPTGRATARLLQMNDSRRVELRFALIKRGLYTA